MRLNDFEFFGPDSQILNRLEYCLLSIAQLATECFIGGTGGGQRSLNYLYKFISEAYKQNKFL